MKEWPYLFDIKTPLIPSSRSRETEGGCRVEGRVQLNHTVLQLACQECSFELVLSILHPHAAQQNSIKRAVHANTASVVRTENTSLSCFDLLVDFQVL